MVSRGRTIYDARQGKARRLSAAECLEVLEFFVERQATNLRTYEHALQIFLRHKRGGRWKALVEELLKAREASWQDFLRELLTRKELTEGDRIRLFQEHGFGSRATYFRRKRQLGL